MRAENYTPNPAPIIFVDGHPFTTTTIIENPIVNNLGPIIANAAPLCNEDSATDNAATSTTESPTTTAIDTAFTCDTENTSENHALPTSDIGVTTADKTAPSQPNLPLQSQQPMMSCPLSSRAQTPTLH